MEIADILSPQAVYAQVKVPSKKKLLTDLAALASGLTSLDAGLIFEALWEREKLGSTGAGHGVAIPHARLPKLEKIIALFAQLEQPVDFEAIDEAPVDLVFLILTPQAAGADHLRALARVSRLMRHAGICEKLRASLDPAALYALLTEPTSGTQAA